MKRFVILLIVLVLAFLVVACANDVQSRGLDNAVSIEQMH